MEAINVQQDKTLLDLENTYLQHREHLIEVNIDMENRTHEFQVQIQELKGKLETLHKTPNKVFQTSYMDNPLKEFEELFFGNVLLKVQNQTLVDKNSKWKDGGKTMQVNY
jgi:hypothetical protein